MDKNINYRYYLHGGISGMVGLIISHPFDTIKTYIQKGIRMPNYHLRILYTGISTPLLGVTVEKAVVFGTYQNTISYTQSNIISGALAGLAASVVVTPIDRVKILLQTNQKYHKQMLNPRYLYQGLTATFSREMPGFAIYFAVYHSLKSKFYQNKIITTSGAFLMGATSGLVAWCFIFPQDCIKTRIQAMRHDMSYRLIIKEIYQNGGMMQFYKGFHLALMRALPLHAGTFATMEYLNGATPQFGVASYRWRDSN